MAEAVLTIDVDAVLANHTALDTKSGPNTETAAVVKANAYGLDVARLGPSLKAHGVRTFFVATTQEAAKLAKAIGKGCKIYVFGGLLHEDAALFETGCFIPLLNAIEHVQTYLKQPGNLPFGLQLDTGMNRLGMEAEELREALNLLGERKPDLVISHLACADDPSHPQNARQLAEFRKLTYGMNCRRSLSATCGTLLGSDYHFDVTRPGIGLYGGAPFVDAKPVVHLDIPVIQTREVQPAESVGYGASWIAKRPSKIATISAGYADGLNRAMGAGHVALFAGDVACPMVGRVSMDLLTVDVTHLEDIPSHLSLLSNHQTVDDLAAAAGTIGYEFLTSLGDRYARRYLDG